jgi:uncharacterized membrane protein YfcA
MTKFIILLGAIIGGAGAGYLGHYIWQSWWAVGILGVIGAFIGSRVAFVIAGLMET